MPKLHKHIKVDHTKALIKECMSKKRLQWKDVAPSVGLKSTSLSNKISFGSDKFTLRFLRDLKNAIGIPPEELVKAIAQDIGVM